jgi:hypothetical protein
MLQEGAGGLFGCHQEHCEQGASTLPAFHRNPLPPLKVNLIKRTVS